MLLDLVGNGEEWHEVPQREKENINPAKIPPAVERQLPQSPTIHCHMTNIQCFRHERVLHSDSLFASRHISLVTHIRANMLEERVEALRPLKRQRIEVEVAPEAPSSTITDEDSSLVRRHPLGVRPSGNALTSDFNLKAACGSFARLPDEILASFLEGLSASSLLRLGGTCRGLHAFTRNEELWRALFVEYVLPS